MPRAVIGLSVKQRGEPADAILAGLAERLHKERFTPSDDGWVPVTLDMRGPEAWDLVRRSLDEIAPDWPDHFWIGERPAS